MHADLINQLTNRYLRGANMPRHPSDDNEHKANDNFFAQWLDGGAHERKTHTHTCEVHIPNLILFAFSHLQHRPKKQSQFREFSLKLHVHVMFILILVTYNAEQLHQVKLQCVQTSNFSRSMQSICRYVHFTVQCSDIVMHFGIIYVKMFTSSGKWRRKLDLATTYDEHKSKSLFNRKAFCRVQFS